MDVIERRTEPRFATEFPCLIQTASGEKIDGVTTNISLSGLEISGPHRLITTICPNFKRPDYHEPIEIKVDICIPKPAVEPIISVRCHLIYARRRKPNFFSMGCKFSEISAHSEKLLGECIDQLSKSASIVIQ